MNNQILIAIGIILFLSAAIKIFNLIILWNNGVSNVLKALLHHFVGRQERVMELRSTKAKAQKKIREFEVKTFHHRYYVVIMKGRKILSISPITAFSIPEEGAFVRGKIDAMNLEDYELRFNHEAE